MTTVQIQLKQDQLITLLDGSQDTLVSIDVLNGSVRIHASGRANPLVNVTCSTGERWRGYCHAAHVYALENAEISVRA